VVSLVPRQVVFVERVDGLSKRKFPNRHCFSTFDTHIIEQRQSSSSLFGRCKKIGDVPKSAFPQWQL
jgi:hypothetical protein